MRRIAFVLAVCASLAAAGNAWSQVCNVRVVTDANPDYTDIGSMLHSITDNWQTMREKCWAIWYWNKIGRRQTSPMQLHGMELTDPIRQFNDYGYTMCSTVAGVNCSIWGAAGWDVKFWDITAHTVAEVFYDGAWHMYDSSLSALYTICDGSRLAGVREIGADGACAASGGRTEPGHIARYHCLNATSANGFLTGADTQRSVADEFRCFNPKVLKYRDYLNNWDLGHRYVLNLRDGEVYTRTYRKLGDQLEFYVPNPPPDGKDPESVNTRYHIRGNGVRTWTPLLAPNDLSRTAESLVGARGMNPSGVVPLAPGVPGSVVFRVEGANVISGLHIDASFLRRTADDAASVAVSTNNGLAWKDVWTAGDQTGDLRAAVKIDRDVTGSYEVLVRVTLMGKADASNAQLRSLAFETITMINSKTQPRLNLGRNMVYVGAGEQTGSVVLWPELQAGKYKESAVDEKGVATLDKHQGWTGVLRAAANGEEGYVTFRVDTPGEMTRLTYGGRFYNRSQKAHINMHYSLDDGKTWTQGYSLTDTTGPWDVIHYEKLDVPPGRRSALVKYSIYSNAVQDTGGGAGIYALRIEANYKVPAPGFRPVEVQFTWYEVEEDYSRVKRSHTQLVDRVPFSYPVNVGGDDHPVMESLRVNLAGVAHPPSGVAIAQPGAAAPQYGYSDGKDVGGQKARMRWVTWGRNLAEGKPYTCSVESGNNWGAGDPDGKKLTDGVVGPPFAGGTSYASSAIYPKGPQPVITVDLGKAEKCAAFRIDIGGYDFQDAMRGRVQDKVEVVTSLDDKDYTSRGFFDFNLRWKDLPANYAFPDDETFNEHNFALIPPRPVEARYVRYVLAPSRLMTVSEVQVMDSVRFDPFDLRIAPPDGRDRSDITRYNPKHTPSRSWRPGQPYEGN